jgi:hypothetical protein
MLSLCSQPHTCSDIYSRLGKFRLLTKFQTAFQAYQDTLSEITSLPRYTFYTLVSLNGYFPRLHAEPTIIYHLRTVIYRGFLTNTFCAVLIPEKAREDNVSPMSS